MPLPDLVKIVRKNISTSQRNALPNGLICLKGGNLVAETQPFKNKVQLRLFHSGSTTNGLTISILYIYRYDENTEICL